VSIEAQRRDVGLGTRLFAYALLLAVVVPAITNTEHWPFTTLKLFSAVRRPVQTGWDVAMVGIDGTERPYPWDELPRSFHFRNHVLDRFGSMSEAERRSACLAWVTAAQQLGRDAAEVRVYRVERRVPSTGEPTGSLLRRELRYQCDTGP
jgi:hypothetical protein